MSTDANRSAPTQALWVALLFVALVSGVARLQPRLARETAAIKAREDVYAFPPPAELRAATFGYVAAATDLLWAKLLVEYGVHWSEHRPFPDLNRYLDAIVGLDPKYKTFYEFVDTMLVFRPVHGTEEDAHAARAYFERGIREMPYDPDIWVHYGQFIAFLAPSWLTTEAERDQWRQDGAAALVHATDLGADIQQTLAATTMLSSRFGEKDAAIRALSREYALTDSESIRAEISAKLEKLQASRQRDQAETVIQTIEGEWRRELPFLRRDTFMLLGPLTDTAACAGPASEGRRECAPSWDDAVVAPSLL
jgi:hypothetical protein